MYNIRVEILSISVIFSIRFLSFMRYCPKALETNVIYNSANNPRHQYRQYGVDFRGDLRSLEIINSKKRPVLAKPSETETFMCCTKLFFLIS